MGRIMRETNHPSMEKTDIPPHIILEESKEVIFYPKKQAPKEKEIEKWMKHFPNEFKYLLMKNPCLFKKMKEHEEHKKKKS
tara:strand:+ start:972 stop:1214 length:243 start_codon:yes stop_codon:yes gene_type:complete